jgi:hypothetical protein
MRDHVVRVRSGRRRESPVASQAGETVCGALIVEQAERRGGARLPIELRRREVGARAGCRGVRRQGQPIPSAGTAATPLSRTL